MVPAARKAAFEELRERLRSAAMPPGRGRLPCEISALDALLGGGFPTGTLTTLEGPVSSGRWAVATRVLAKATRRGLAALVDDGEAYPPGLAAAGVTLERLLVVPAPVPLATARVADTLLRSHACSVVALEAPTLRPTVWSRLAGLAHKNGTLLLVITTSPPPALATAAHVRVRFERSVPGALRVRVRHESVCIPCLP